eukprot:7028474-Lingulodinium_polyedra.AAC.1
MSFLPPHPQAAPNSRQGDLGHEAPPGQRETAPRAPAPAADPIVSTPRDIGLNRGVFARYHRTMNRPFVEAIDL